MNTKRQLFRSPNRLICDDTLSYSARRVGIALYSRRNHLGQCVLSLAYLAKLSACSIPTIRKAVDELERAGYLGHCRNYQYRQEIGRVGYAKTTYSCTLSLSKDYTLIPREIFGWSLTHGAFCVCLSLFQQAGNAERAFPSIRRIARLLGMGRATVCRALGTVRRLRAFLVLRCKKRNRSFGSNSYYLGVTHTLGTVFAVASTLLRKGLSVLSSALILPPRTEKGKHFQPRGVVSFFTNCTRT